MPVAPDDVPGLLRQHGLRPDQSLGQNFLIDEAALRRVVTAAGIEGGEAVLEIGPGLGSLTRHLAAAARRVVAVELDGRLISPLREALAPYPNVQIIVGDILTLDPSALMGEPGYLVVANIPYYITSALIRHLLEASPSASGDKVSWQASSHRSGQALRPRRLALTVQREVAERICAAPGEMSLLALSVQVYGRPRIAAHIPAGAFYPPPKVDSSVVRVDLFDAPLLPAALLPAFFRLAKAGFSQKRKTLRNALAGGLGCPAAQAEALLRQAGIDPMRRAETLSIEEWGRLVEGYVD